MPLPLADRIESDGTVMTAKANQPSIAGAATSGAVRRDVFLPCPWQALRLDVGGNSLDFKADN